MVRLSYRYIDKIKKLKEMSTKTPIIELDTYYFNEYVEAPEKNYSFIILFITPMADDHYDIRRHFYDQCLPVAKALTKIEFKTNLFFGVVDTVKEPLVFESMKVRYLRDTGTLITKITSLIIHYPSSERLTPSDYLDLQHIELGDITDKIISLIETRVLPTNTVKNRYLWYLDHKENVAWAIVGFCAFNVSGIMWTWIKGPQIHGIALWLDKQTVVETYIIAATILLSVTSMIVIIESMNLTKKHNKDRVSKNTKVIFGISLLVICFIIINVLFHVKMAAMNYPYRPYL